MEITLQDYQDVLVRAGLPDRQSRVNYLMSIFVDGKRKYRIDTREGYTKEEFLEMMKAVGRSPVLG